MSARPSAISFEDVCSHIAIAQTSDRRALIESLIIQTFVIVHPETMESPDVIADNLLIVFRVPLDRTEILQQIDSLMERSIITRPTCAAYVIAESLFATTRNQIESAHDLEAAVEHEWHNYVEEHHPELDDCDTWPALKAYLFAAFRRHGIQAAALLDARITAGAENIEGLASVLHKVVVQRVEPELHEKLKHAISGYMRLPSSEQGTRSKYISKLANAAYNFYSLQAPPEIAANIRANLEPLVIFLDTNFLSGILDLHINSQVMISEHLIESCLRYKLPFRFRYLDITKEEFTNTFAFYSRSLRGHRWPQSVSRAALKAPMLSGIELKYHSMNADTPLEPDMFLNKYQHFDVLLKHKGIEIFRMKEDYASERSKLYFTI